jgi:predicted MFS family arabinose efflux permease
MVSSTREAPGSTAGARRWILICLAGAQLAHTLEFMMINPLGPPLLRAAGESVAAVGWLTASYTVGATVTAVLAAPVANHLDRRLVFPLSLFGLAAATAAVGFVQGFPALVAVRLLAGAFGGQATALTIALTTDASDESARGKAMALVLGAASIAAVLGVPAVLEIWRRFGLHAPFYVVAGLVALIGVVSLVLLGRPGALANVGARPAEAPPSSHWRSSWQLWRRAGVPAAFAASSLLLISSFVVVPNVAAYVQANGSMTEGALSTLYCAGGIASFVLMHASGRAVDRLGAGKVLWTTTALFIAAVALGFSGDRPFIAPGLAFVLFMGAQSSRAVALATLTSRVPTPSERARFQILYGAAQNIAIAAGAALAGAVVGVGPGGALLGMYKTTLVSVAASCLGLAAALRVRRQLRA